MHLDISSVPANCGLTLATGVTKSDEYDWMELIMFKLSSNASPAGKFATIFTDNLLGCGKDLFEWLRKYPTLGKTDVLFEVPPINPNHHHPIQVWGWSPPSTFNWDSIPSELREVYCRKHVYSANELAKYRGWVGNLTANPPEKWIMKTRKEIFWENPEVIKKWYGDYKDASSYPRKPVPIVATPPEPVKSPSKSKMAVGAARI